ncbi:hypothetical protein E3T25_13460 [Cryobacterium sandaracinum]|uniref:Uncharacterized protein n=1 Tax=Cryobacterium sandaracinum TaxID=1259247 RepID=A0ABY2J8T3_9MICO|nr:hypothetical protein [Cryobacterium sandaracinum]TFD00064.1 hypothetical protein E3T25_13460 [Cryobacterium sandaracinum]
MGGALVGFSIIGFVILVGCLVALLGIIGVGAGLAINRVFFHTPMAETMLGAAAPGVRHVVARGAPAQGGIGAQTRGGGIRHQGGRDAGGAYIFGRFVSGWTLRSCSRWWPSRRCLPRSSGRPADGRARHRSLEAEHGSGPQSEGMPAELSPTPYASYRTNSTEILL